MIVLILKYLTQQTNTYSKSAPETLKANSRRIAFFYKQLVGYLRLCSSAFWCTRSCLCLLRCFCCYFFNAMISFSMSLFRILNRFHTLIYFYLLSVLHWVQKKPAQVFFIKGVLWNCAMFTEKYLYWGLFLIKL